MLLYGKNQNSILSGLELVLGRDRRPDRPSNRQNYHS